MCRWDDYCQSTPLPAATLVGQIHDELLFEVPDRPGAMEQAAALVQRMMQVR